LVLRVGLQVAALWRCSEGFALAEALLLSTSFLDDFIAIVRDEGSPVCT
jgi:hypothetical protein